MHCDKVLCSQKPRATRGEAIPPIFITIRDEPNVVFIPGKYSSTCEKRHIENEPCPSNTRHLVVDMQVQTVGANSLFVRPRSSLGQPWHPSHPPCAFARLFHHPCDEVISSRQLPARSFRRCPKCPKEQISTNAAALTRDQAEPASLDTRQARSNQEHHQRDRDHTEGPTRTTHDVDPVRGKQERRGLMVSMIYVNLNEFST